MILTLNFQHTPSRHESTYEESSQFNPAQLDTVSISARRWVSKSNELERFIQFVFPGILNPVPPKEMAIIQTGLSCCTTLIDPIP